MQVTVCGGGNAAHIAAGMFTHNGADVNLFFSFEEEAQKFRKGCEANNGVEVRSKTGTYKAKPKVISSKAEEVRGGFLLLLAAAIACLGPVSLTAPRCRPSRGPTLSS